MNLSSLWSSSMLQFQLADKFTYIQGEKEQPAENTSASSSIAESGNSVWSESKMLEPLQVSLTALWHRHIEPTGCCMQGHHRPAAKPGWGHWEEKVLLIQRMSQGTYLIESFPGFGKRSETAVTLADLKEMEREERNSIEIKFLNGIAKVCIFSRLYTDHIFRRLRNVCLEDRSCEALQMLKDLKIIIKNVQFYSLKPCSIVYR